MPTFELHLHLPVVDEFAHGHNFASTFVSANKWKLGWKWPVSIHSVQVGVTYTGILDIDENLIWSWLLDGNLLVLNRTASLLNDLGPLHFWDLRSHVCGNMW